jgi:hypothetical protein
MNPKWQRYYCLLMKDHILFNKQPDDRIPKDCIVLKNFTVKKTAKQCSFMLIDLSKNVEHEFYSETWEEFHDWWQYLNEISAKLSFNYQEITLSQSPILMHNSIKTDNSSRESSPFGSPGSKIASRDSSPSLIYRKFGKLFEFGSYYCLFLQIANQSFKAGNTSDSENEAATFTQKSSPSLVKYGSQFSLPQTNSLVIF